MKQAIEEALQENVSSGFVNYFLLDGDAQEVGESWTRMPEEVRNLTADYAAALFSNEDYDRLDREDAYEDRLAEGANAEDDLAEGANAEDDLAEDANAESDNEERKE